jgi:hypothetical protein
LPTAEQDALGDNLHPGVAETLAFRKPSAKNQLKLPTSCSIPYVVLLIAFLMLGVSYLCLQPRSLRRRVILVGQNAIVQSRCEDVVGRGSEQYLLGRLSTIA